MLNRSHWMAIGGVVFAGFVLAAVPLVQRASATVPAATTEPAATTTSKPHPAASLATAPTCASCGTVADVHAVVVGGNTSGVGGVTGGVLGAVVGHQFGGGNGKTLASIAGAVGGAVAGNAVERNMKRHTRYDVVVRMADGRRETVSYESLPPFRIGEAVRLEGGSLRAANV